ncbi:nacht and ankyrin domain protein [Lasallia pustulata]|uniref:Nacht and ankyrin domain protein n=1 Tax=Lasallia pustulata TaxID=136370 RepID=A0A1W5CSC9_9LECA|nr:nacht and ankyrin domain protein [Lasallia pustulata]
MVNDPNSNVAVRMDYTSSAIFQRNYLPRMICYDNQAAYRSVNIRQEEEIQELRDRRDELFQRIRHQFTFIYRAEGHAIYNQYEEAKRAIQKEYDAVTPVQDMRAQLEGDAESLNPILSTSGPVQYVFVGRSRIAKAFFDPPSTHDAESDLDWRVSIVDDMVSLCVRQEGVFRKARRIWRTQDSGLRGSEHTVNDAKESNRKDTVADAKLRVDSETMTVPRLGVGILHQPSNPPAAVVDILFVHGLTGEPANTWLHTASGMYWPATLLNRDVPNSRILSFGYDADVVSFWSPTSQNRIGNHALNMLGGLTRLREKSDTENRKIIFVTHSLGGLVTQDCLFQSRSHPEKHLQQISSCTIGIVFLGTPHHGADLAAWAKFGSTIAKTIKHVNSDIVSVLKPGSEILARVQDGFHGLLRLRRNEESEIAVTCFFEELPLPLVGKVVEMESAILPGYASYGIHANHMDMTKFDNKDNAGYESVLGELRRWVKGLQPALGTAPTVRVKAQKGKPETRPQDRRDDQEAELLETLASDYKGDKDSISVRVPGTCEWFFEDDRFLEWRDSTYSRLLWVSAGPGCGKSVLSRALIDERRVCKNPMDSTVCYFFFKDGQEQRTHGTDALSAVLHQLFENTGLITYALPSYRNYGKKLRDAFSELWEILVRSARDSEVGEIVFVLDALDECEQNARKQLTEKLVSFFSQMEPHDNPSFALKFLITSRPYDDLEQNFQPLSGVSTYLHFDGDENSQRIGQEINLVIDAKIPSIAGDFSDEDRKRISQRLKKMDNRTYLWLFLTIDIIAGSRSKFRKDSC